MIWVVGVYGFGAVVSNDGKPGLSAAGVTANVNCRAYDFRIDLDKHGEGLKEKEKRERDTNRTC